MFFLQQRNYKQHLDKQFLTHFRSVLYNSFFCSAKTPLVLSIKMILQNVVRRMSLWPSPHKLPGTAVKAGITLEAALVLPAFIFFILNMFSVMEMLRLYGNMAFALNQVGGEIALYGYAYEKADRNWDTGIVGDVAFSYLYVKEEIVETLGEDYIENSPLVNGEEGILFAKSQILEDNLVELVVFYEMETPFAMGATGEIRTYNSYQGRAWTGYEVEGTNEEWVYIAENGEVYHVYEDCSYLELDIWKVDISAIKKLTNKEGDLYTRCELCGGSQSNVVWITGTGARYHTSEECLGIKRTVYKVPADEVDETNYKMCSRCRDR